MSNQSFDPNSTASDSASDGKPIPIAQQLRQQSYLSNIQHRLEELMEASGAQEPDNDLGLMLPSSSRPASSPPSAPARVNKMDSFFEQMAAEEEAVANELAAKLASTTEEAENAPSNIGDMAETRPTGYAGLSAGLAAAGLGNLGARLAEESNRMSDNDSVADKSDSTADPSQPLTTTPTIPVIDPSFSAHSFDLEAARLEEVAGPVFSQEFDEKELSPEERLLNRLQREKLVASRNVLADQLLNSPPPAFDQQPTFVQQPAVVQQPVVVQQPAVIQQPAFDQPVADGNAATFANASPLRESDPQRPEPIADLFVEVPQVRQPVDDQLNVPQENRVQPPKLLPGQTPYSTVAPITDTPSHPPLPAKANVLDAPPPGPQALPRQPSMPPMQAPEAPIDPRLVEAKRFEDQFKQLQKQEASLLQKAQSEQIEHELSVKADSGAAEKFDSYQSEVPAGNTQEGTQRVEDAKLAAIQQAERVKEAREKANQIGNNDAIARSAEKDPNAGQDLSHQQIETTPQPPTMQQEGQPANQSVFVPPAILNGELPPTDSSFPPSEKQNVKRLANSQQFEIDLFHSCMLEHLSDGVVFVDHKQRVKLWSRGAQKATGIISEVVLDRPLLPQTINLCDTAGNGLQLDKCPVAKCLRTLEIVTGEYKISTPTSSEGLKVELTVIPVIDKNRYVNGAVAMFHDRTAHVNLQQQLKDLYEFSVLDPLTQVANRAEFERVQQEYVLAFQQSDDFNCSIIICDIDFFKSINDNFGHTVGDEALMSFADMLKRYVRPQDLVARYGGEEFVILCADCDTAAAVERAEQIRMALYKTPQPMLGGKSISASFGVSELREGDTATDFFVRADTALLKAKESGRNRVVAGDGSSLTKSDETATELSATGIRWTARQRRNKALICEEFKTETPIQVLVEKLRGFIIENDALLQRVEPEFLSMEIEAEAPKDYSKKGAFTMNIEFKEAKEPIPGTSRTKTVNYIRVTIYAGQMRSWFSTNHIDLAPHILGVLRRFLMISDKASRISVDLATEKVR